MRQTSAVFGFFEMKQHRHNAIREVVRAAAILNQDELRRKLRRRGFDVTQATLSRDIHEIQISKGPKGYALPEDKKGEEEQKDLTSISGVLNTFGLKVSQAMNQLVLNTTNGSAQPVALAIDKELWPEVLGTIAGDDTVLVICPDNKRATHLRSRLEEMMG